MRLDPREALALAAKGPAMVELALTLLPRAAALLDSAEELLDRVDRVVDRVDRTRQSADAAIATIDATNTKADEAIGRIDATITQAEGLVVRGAGLVASIEPTMERGQRMFDVFAPIVERLQPIADRLSRTMDPDEVEAIVRLVDHLPDLVDRIETDVLPMLETLRSVGPDVHDLLDITRELNSMLGRVPGMGRVKKRVDEQQERNAVAGEEDR
ncbi:MAG: hypothetical protein JWP56_1735 [Aeromicrobium sp.]|nr:hypothetical protein [Aeromicrobium sp.]